MFRIFAFLVIRKVGNYSLLAFVRFSITSASIVKCIGKLYYSNGELFLIGLEISAAIKFLYQLGTLYRFRDTDM